jgi:IS30 family transposase
MRNIRYLLEKYVNEQDVQLAPPALEKDRVRVYPLTKETKDEILRLSQTGLSPIKIAETIGRSVTAVRNVIKIARLNAQRSAEQSPRKDPQSSRKPGFPRLRQVKAARLGPQYR